MNTKPCADCEGTGEIPRVDVNAIRDRIRYLSAATCPISAAGAEIELARFARSLLEELDIALADIARDRIPTAAELAMVRQQRADAWQALGDYADRATAAERASASRSAPATLVAAQAVADTALALMLNGDACPFCDGIRRHEDDVTRGARTPIFVCPLRVYEQANGGKKP